MTDPSRPRRRNLQMSFPETQNLGFLAIVEAVDVAVDRIVAALTASVPHRRTFVKIANPRAQGHHGPTDREATAPDATWTGQGLANR